MTLSTLLSPAWAKQRDSGEPIRSTPPRASTRSSAMSNRRYLKLVLPRLATRIFTAASSSDCSAADKDPGHLEPDADCAHDRADDSDDQCILLRPRVRAGGQTHDAQDEGDKAAADAEEHQEHH